MKDSAYETAEWYALRDEVISEAGGICEVCGVNAAETAHHKSYCQGVICSKDFLIAICWSCHQRLQRIRIKGSKEKPMSTEPEALIDLITAQTRGLLANHWTDIQSYRDGDAEIKIAFTHALSYEGDLKIVKTTISFSHRIKDQVEESINTAQEELPIKMEIEKRKRK